MKASRVESWALRVLDALRSGSKVEDGTVELKASWPEPARAARRLAAHANAARGADILWLIGVDETRGAVGAAHQELSSWFSKVKSQFDGVFPALYDIDVHWGGLTVVALCFETLRAPFVVRNPAFGKVQGDAVEWEVPWREGTATRSAGRNDLVQLLDDLRVQPKVEVLSAMVRLASKSDKDPNPPLYLTMELYIIPRGELAIVFPFHRCLGNVTTDDRFLGVLRDFRIRPGKRKGLALETIQRVMARMHRDLTPQVHVKTGNDPVVEGAGDVVVRGPGKIELSARCEAEFAVISTSGCLEVSSKLIEGASDCEVPVSCLLKKLPTQPDGSLRWEYDASP